MEIANGPTMKMKYRKHIFSNLNAIINDFKTADKSEGKKMFEALYPIIIKLQKNEINDLKNITGVFRDCGFNNKSTNQILIFLLNNLNVKSRINRRTINKLNDSYRNIIFTSLFHDFPDNIISIIDHFISNYCPDIHNHDFLIHKLKQLISSNNLQTIEIINDTAHENTESNKISQINETELSLSLSLLDFKEEDYYSKYDIDVENIGGEF